MDRVRDTESFIKKANTVHSYRFTYEKTEYVKSSVKVIITCPIHGDFEQTPNNHLSGLVGCKECVSSTKQKPNLPSYWIKRAIAVHGDSYSYSEFKPSGAFNKTTVVCNKTGQPFKISPDGHINGKKGCPCCKSSRISDRLSVSIEDAQKRLDEIFNGKFKILKDYKNYSTKCSVICEDHGVFSTVISSLIGLRYGCPSCAKENKRSGFYYDGILNRTYYRQSKERNNLYIMSFGDGIYKIGLAKNVQARCTNISKEYKDCQVVSEFPTNTIAAFMVEEHLHELFNSKRFKCDTNFAGSTELFSLSQNELDFVIDYTGRIVRRLDARI